MYLKQLIISFFFLLHFGVTAGQDDPNKQSFLIENFEFTPAKTIIEQSQFRFSFDLIMTHPLSDYYLHPYSLKYCLKTTSGKIIYKGNYDKKIKAQPYYKNKKIAKEEYIRLSAPYALMDIPSGEHKIILELSVKSSSADFGIIDKRELKIIKPELFEYKSQEFDIRNYGVKNDVKYNKIKGIMVSFTCNYKFKTTQIKELYKSNDYEFYEFKVILRDKKSGLPVSYFHPESALNRTSPINLSESIKIHIPYYQINLPEGKHELVAELYIQGFDGITTFGKHVEQVFELDQPALYLVYFDMISCHAVHKKYDTSTAVGRFFSGNTNRGRGYPETFWGIQNGDYWRYQSAWNKNSYTAPPGKATFVITDNDLVYFSVYDYDIIPPNQLMGKYKIKHLPGNQKISKRNLKFPGIISADFDFEKIKFPYPVQKNISSEICKQNGLSGFCISGNYELPPILYTEHIHLTPVVLKDEKVINAVNLIAPEDRRVPENIEPDIHFFMPFYKLKGVEKIGYSLELEKANLKITDVFTNDTLIIPNFNDTKLKPIRAVQDTYNEDDICGVTFYSGVDVSQAYIDCGHLKSKLTFANSQNPEINAERIINKYKNEDRLFFVPYYKLAQGGNMQTFELSETSFIEDFKIGENKTSITIDCPESEKISFNKLSVKFKNPADFKQLSYQIIHDKKITAKGDIENPASGNDIKISGLPFRCYKKDKLELYILGEDKSGITSVISKTDIRLSEFKKSKLKLKNPAETIKKIYLYLD